MRTTTSLVAIIFGLSFAGAVLAADVSPAPANGQTATSAPAEQAPAKAKHVRHTKKVKKIHHKRASKGTTETAK